MSATSLFDWAARSIFQGLTGRSLAAEAAEEEQARASAKEAKAAQEEEREHRATLESLAAQTLEATLALQSPVADEGTARQARDAERKARADEHRAQDEVRREAARALEERKKALADQGKSHVPEIHSSMVEQTAHPEGATSTLKVA